MPLDVIDLEAREKRIAHVEQARAAQVAQMESANQQALVTLHIPVIRVPRDEEVMAKIKWNESRQVRQKAQSKWKKEIEPCLALMEASIEKVCELQGVDSNGYTRDVRGARQAMEVLFRDDNLEYLFLE